MAPERPPIIACLCEVLWLAAVSSAVAEGAGAPPCVLAGSADEVDSGGPDARSERWQRYCERTDCRTGANVVGVARVLLLMLSLS